MCVQIEVLKHFELDKTGKITPTEDTPFVVDIRSGKPTGLRVLGYESPLDAPSAAIIVTKKGVPLRMLLNGAREALAHTPTALGVIVTDPQFNVIDVLNPNEIGIDRAELPKDLIIRLSEAIFNSFGVSPAIEASGEIEGIGVQSPPGEGSVNPPSDLLERELNCPKHHKLMKAVMRLYKCPEKNCDTPEIGFLFECQEERCPKHNTPMKRMTLLKCPEKDCPEKMYL